VLFCNISCFQIQSTDGHFVDAVPIDNTVVVNVGDMLQFMTCGELKSTVNYENIVLINQNISFALSTH